MKTQKRLVRWMLTVMLLCMLSACTPYQGPTEQSTSPSDGTHESYTEKQLQTREAFDQLTEQLFLDELQNSSLDLHYMISDPQAFGITDYEVTLGDFTLEGMQQNTQDLKDLQVTLDQIEPKYLSSNQLLTYRLLMDHITTELSSEGLEYYYRPLSPTIGIQAQLPVLLAEYTFSNQKDVEDYLLLLADIDRYYGQIIEFEKQKSAAGLGNGDQMLEHIIQSCHAYMVRPENNFLTQTFEEKLEGLPQLSDEQKADYKEQHLAIIKDEFIPAYQTMSEELEALKGTGVTNYGLAYYPQGKDYYEYLVASATGTRYTIPQLKEAVQAQMDQDFVEMYQILSKKPELYQSLDEQSFTLTDPLLILEDLKKQINKDFPTLPSCDYTVKYVPEALETSLSPAFYLVPPIDNFRDNTIYINGNEAYSNSDLYTTLAHEGYPGHLYQTVYFSSHNDSNLRRILSCGGYTEGWATYVEHYSYTLNNGLDPDVGKLQALNSSATLALYATLDINIHYDGWTFEQAKQFLTESYGITDEEVASEIYYSLADNPGNYLEYYVGYLEIVEMRKTAEETLKQNFDLKRFHSFLLDMGPCSFRVIEPYFKVWMTTYKGI